MYLYVEKKKWKRYPYYASRPGSVIYPQWLELSLSRTNFHSPKGVRSIEIRLYIDTSYCFFCHSCKEKEDFCFAEGLHSAWLQA